MIKSHLLVKRLIFSVAFVAAAPFIASASPATDAVRLDGQWKFEYSCAGATGPYADRCAVGERDDFNLSIVHKNGKICGSYETTAQLGNHVDDGPLGDWKFETIRKGTYRVHFHLSGTVGVALANVIGDKMAWKLVAKHPSGESGPLDWSFSPPTSAILVREPADQVRHPAECNS